MTAPHPIVHLNAALNCGAALLIGLGFGAIKTGRKGLHRAAMIAALLCSAAFLAGYLWYHANFGSIRYPGPHRPLYLGTLLVHIILAALIVPLVPRTAYLALRGRFADHARIARWTLPIWMTVSATGVVVYWMLYRL